MTRAYNFDHYFSWHILFSNMRYFWCSIVALVAVVVVSANRYHPDVTFNTKATPSNDAEQDPDYWRNEAKEGIEKRLRRLQNKNIARNVIMFLGDGLSVPTLAAARILKGQRENRTGEEAEMFFETFPTVGLSKVGTYTFITPVITLSFVNLAISLSIDILPGCSNRGFCVHSHRLPDWSKGQLWYYWRNGCREKIRLRGFYGSFHSFGFNCRMGSCWRKRRW